MAAAPGGPSFSHKVQEMAEQEGFSGAGEQLGNGGENGPQFGIISQYVKDLSFENPNAPAVYQWQGQPQIDVQFNIGAQKLGDDVHEVVLKIDIKAKAEDKIAFAVELVYAGLVAARNIPEEQLQPGLLAEVPRLLFPFARRTIAEAVQDGGFPPLMLEPIDFGALYMQQAAQAQAQVAAGQAPEISGEA
jgi:preprotein translocase subunit SecB